MNAHDKAEAWVALYRRAWETNDETDIRAVFTDDAVYKGRPDDDESERGIDAIVAGWIENRDEPGDWTFEHEVLGVDGDLAFIQGTTDYRAADRPLYFNLWVVRLADDCKASEFTEWWMTPRE